MSTGAQLKDQITARIIWMRNQSIVQERKEGEQRFWNGEIPPRCGFITAMITDHHPTATALIDDIILSFCTWRTVSAKSIRSKVSPMVYRRVYRGRWQLYTKSGYILLHLRYTDFLGFDTAFDEVEVVGELYTNEPGDRIPPRIDWIVAPHFTL